MSDRVSPFGRRHGRPVVTQGGSGRALTLFERGHSLEHPPAIPPDCPPAEREAAVAAFDALCRERPLKPPSVRP